VPATFLIPAGWQSLGSTAPYTETTGTFRIEASLEVGGDMFPTNRILDVPKIMISGRR
jgi:hypothetical protein